MAYQAPVQSFFTGFTRGLDTALKLKKARQDKEDELLKGKDREMKLMLDQQEYEHKKVMNPINQQKGIADLQKTKTETVSYTHLTLPTILLV